MHSSASSTHDAIQYARDVSEGRIVASVYVRKQCKAFIYDLDHRQHQDDCRWYFDEDASEHALTFMQLLNFVEGKVAGSSIVLQPWQAFIIATLYGFRDKNNPAIRRYTKAIVLVGRKNGKSTLLGALALYELLTAPEGSQIVTLATMREQARLVWNMSKRIAQVSDKRLTAGFNFTTSTIANTKKWSRYWALSKESKSLDGLSIRMAIVDEAAAIQNHDLFQVVESSMGAQISPLTVYITTGAHGAQSNHFYDLLDYSKKVLDGVISDERVFALPYEIDIGDDWKVKKNWHKSNPNMGVSVSEQFLDEEFARAEEITTSAANFRTKYLNEFISTSESWVQLDTWNQNIVSKIDTSLPLYVGLDLGSTDDLTAVTQVFAQDGQMFIRTKCFVPERAFQNVPKHVRQIYNEGVKSGTLVVTEGEVADHKVIREYIHSLATEYDLKEVAFDSWNASQITALLQESGLPMVKFGQGMGAMSPAAKDTELLIRNGTLKHLDDKFLAWQLSNCEIYRDVNDNIKVRKGSDKALKIDAIIAGIMAVGRATTLGALKKPKVFDYYIG